MSAFAVLKSSESWLSTVAKENAVTQVPPTLSEPSDNANQRPYGVRKRKGDLLRPELQATKASSSYWDPQYMLEPHGESAGNASEKPSQTSNVTNDGRHADMKTAEASYSR